MLNVLRARDMYMAYNCAYVCLQESNSICMVRFGASAVASSTMLCVKVSDGLGTLPWGANSWKGNSQDLLEQVSICKHKLKSHFEFL